LIATATREKQEDTMPQRIPQVRRILFNGEEIGMGFNSETGLAVGTALESFTVTADPVAIGGEAFSTVTIVDTHESLMDSLGLSFDAQGRYGFFSGGAKMDFAESSSFNSTSTFLVAKCVVRNALRRGRGFRVIEDPANLLLHSQRFEEFRTAFGDCFVRALQTGGEFYAVVRITSSSTTTQLKLAATLHAEYNGLVAAGSFQAAFNLANQEANTRSEFTATMFQRAGVGDQLSPVVSTSEAIARYKSFPGIANKQPIAYETEVVTYDTLPLPVPTLEEQEDFLFALRDARSQKLRFIQARNDLEFARRNREFFEDLPEDTVLANAATVYVKLINAVMEHAIALSRGEIRPPRIFDPSLLTPPLVEPDSIPMIRRKVAVADPIGGTLARIRKSDPEAAPFFAVPNGDGLERPFPGPDGGKFVVFDSNLRPKHDGTTSMTFGPTGAIFSHPAFGTHYVYGDVFSWYEWRYRLCFGNAGFNMGYPVDDVVHTVFNTTPTHFQRFEHGDINNEFGDTDNNTGNFVDHSTFSKDQGFVWQGHP
jgi:hypothetical protein